MAQHIARLERERMHWRAMAESVARDEGPPQHVRRVPGARPTRGDTPRGIALVAHLGLDEGLDLVDHQGVLGLQSDLARAKGHPAAHKIM